LLRFLKLALIFVLVAVCLADSLTYMRVDRSVIEKRLQPVPAGDKERVDAIRAQFRAAGCAPEMLQEQTVPDEELPNLICIVPGPDPGAIVVGTRLESKSKGDEAEVDWGGPILLPLLAESMISAPHHQTMIFVAFAGHDHGLAGANYFLSQLNDEQRAQIQAMIQIDKVGRAPVQYGFPAPDTSRMATVGKRPVAMEPGHAPTTLSKVLPLAAGSLKLADQPTQNNDIPATEARVFEAANIPSIVIHSPSYLIVSPPGRMEAVHLSRTALDPKVYNETYNLMCVYLLYLDKVYYLAQSKAAATQVAKAGTVPGNNGGNAQPTGASAVTATNAAPAGSAATPSQTASQPATAQASPSAEGAGTNPIFRTTARLVQVDVVVTDKQGRPIPGLTQADFTVLQDGKPQKVRVFEPHTGNAAVEASSPANAAPKLPPDTYSNHPNAAIADSWTIVLFDVLNTPTTDQEYARKQLLELLNTVPKGRPVALYLLTNRLTMIQGFTDEPEKLLQAAENLRPSNSHVLTTEAQRQQEVGQITAANAELTANVPGGTTSNPVVLDSNNRQLQQLRDMESFRIADRANFTLAAFEALSRAVSGYPGRKNLIWLSASFPIQIMADPTQVTQPWRNSSNFRKTLAEAGVLLAKSRIAVYPTDVRGLQGRGVDIRTSASASGEWTGASNAGNYGNLIGEQTAAFTEERTTMKQIAEQTGGEAFVGTNDLKLAMKRSMDDGSTYYTLAYTPDKIDPETAFHKIEVKTNQSNVKLAYRRGYYSAGQKVPEVAVGAAALRGALQPGMPPATMVFFTATVLPPDATHKDVRIQYVVNPNTITFEDVADNKKRIVLDCIAIAYDKEGHEVGHASDTLDGAIQTAAYETVMARGVPAKQEMTLPAGVYNLRLGIMDRASQQIGTLDVPLVIPETVAAKQ
jgi:VWFA-related protein